MDSPRASMPCSTGSTSRACRQSGIQKSCSRRTIRSSVRRCDGESTLARKRESTPMTNHLHPSRIYEQLGLTDAPLLIDVRSKGDLDRTPRLIPGALHFEAAQANQWV